VEEKTELAAPKEYVDTAIAAIPKSVPEKVKTWMKSMTRY
jgi:hypothetical protein